MEMMVMKTAIPLTETTLSPPLQPLPTPIRFKKKGELPNRISCSYCPKYELLLFISIIYHFCYMLITVS